jgi:Ca2+-binding EF-hand superfamily protein
MKTTLSMCAAAIATLLAGNAIAGDDPHGDSPRGDIMRADKDGDGKVSRAEAAAAATSKSDEWFDKLDLNKDGFITPDEIKQAHEARREQMHEMFEEHFKAADTNNDGKLSLEEVQAKMPRLAEHFSQLDTDKDGFLSKEELQHGGPGGYGGHHKPQQPPQPG